MRDGRLMFWKQGGRVIVRGLCCISFHPCGIVCRCDGEVMIRQEFSLVRLTGRE